MDIAGVDEVSGAADGDDGGDEVSHEEHILLVGGGVGGVGNHDEADHGSGAKKADEEDARPLLAAPEGDDQATEPEGGDPEDGDPDSWGVGEGEAEESERDEDSNKNHYETRATSGDIAATMLSLTLGGAREANGLGRGWGLKFGVHYLEKWGKIRGIFGDWERKSVSLGDLWA